MAAKRIDYMTDSFLVLDGKGFDDDAEERLKKHGGQGWTIVSVTPGNSPQYVTVVFARGAAVRSDLV